MLSTVVTLSTLSDAPIYVFDVWDGPDEAGNVHHYRDCIPVATWDTYSEEFKIAIGLLIFYEAAERIRRAHE